MSWSRTLATMALIVVAVTGCAAPAPDAPQPPPAVADDAPVATDAPRVPQGDVVESLAGAWRIVYVTEPAPVPLNAPFSVRAWVLDADTGAARTDVDVIVDAGMPQHRHGMNHEPRHTRLADGGVLAEGLLFHMTGDWTLTFDVTEGGITERAEVVIAVDE